MVRQMGLIEDFAKTLVPPVCAPKTKEAYLTGAKRFLRYLEKINLTILTAPPVAMEGYILALSEEGLAPNSIRLYAIGASEFIDWCRSHGTPVPEQTNYRLPKIKKRKPIVLEPTTLGKYMVSCSKLPEPYGSALQMLPLTGLRVDELCQLLLSDVHKTPQWVELWVRGKSASERIVPILPAGAKLFARYIVQVRPKLGPSAYLFPAHGKALSKRKAQLHVAAIREELQLTHLTPHTLRHTYATYLARAGFSPFDIARILGHESIQTTQGYVHLTNDNISFAKVNADWVKDPEEEN